MPRKAKELTPLAVAKITTPGLHFVGGVAGLALQVTPRGARSWILRVMIGGKRRDMGLGGFPDVPLALAKERARQERERIDTGIDPVEERKTAKSLLAAQRASAITFKAAAVSFIESKGDEWKNAKHRQQWENTLQTYAYPIIGDLAVRDIEKAHVLRILEPLWKTKTETATRVRGRIESILDWAKARGYRQGDNPAAWRGHLDKILPSPKKIAKQEHHAAMDFRDIGAFMEALRKQEGLGAKALEFGILTATRSGEIRGAVWSEIDLAERTWLIPAERMKADKEHKVPLSPDVVALLQQLPRFAETDLLFPSRKNTPLSDATLNAVLRRMGHQVTQHGFRSTFRDWAAERTNFPNHVCEMALAHTIDNKVEAAYRRGDLFEKRRKMMEAWASYCNSVERKADNIIPLQSKAIA